MRPAALCLALLLGPFAPAAASGQPSREVAARVELHAFETLNVDDQQFLTGVEARPLTIAGELRLAQGNGRRPAVVLVHGSGGIASNVEPWTRHLNALGISTFVPDGFTARRRAAGSGSVFPGRLGLIVDSYRALELLAGHPEVDRERIALMGFSRGGQAALYAGLTRFERLWNRSGTRFAGFVPVYPDCVTTYRNDLARDAPVLLLHGQADDQNPLAPCLDYVDRLRVAGRDVRPVTYPNAFHGFDDPLAPASPVLMPEAQSVRRCRVRESEPGRLLNVETSAPFTIGDGCVERGTHAGRDDAATAAARAEVASFLERIFRRP